MRLNQKAALITGAGGPMGRAIARKFALEGANLILSDISGNRLNETVQLLQTEFPNCTIVNNRANAIDAAEANEVARLALEQFGAVDILINVVGGIRSQQLYTPFLEMSETQWDETFALNLKPNFHFIKVLAPKMLEQGYGKIVNIASIVFSGEIGQADYAAAKAATASLTRTLAKEFAPLINVNAIAPGIIKTSVTERMEAKELSRLTHNSMFKRLGQAEEIANTACFLSSDEASFITGEIISVSGGVQTRL